MFDMWRNVSIPFHFAEQIQLELLGLNQSHFVYCSLPCLSFFSIYQCEVNTVSCLRILDAVDPLPVL